MEEPLVCVCSIDLRGRICVGVFSCAYNNIISLNLYIPRYYHYYYYEHDDYYSVVFSHNTKTTTTTPYFVTVA